MSKVESLLNLFEVHPVKLPDVKDVKDPKGDLTYVVTNDDRYPSEHVYYNPATDEVFFYQIKDGKSVVLPYNKVQKDNYALPFIDKIRSKSEAAKSVYRDVEHKGVRYRLGKLWNGKYNAIVHPSGKGHPHEFDGNTEKEANDKAKEHIEKRMSK